MIIANTERGALKMRKSNFIVVEPDTQVTIRIDTASADYYQCELLSDLLNKTYDTVQKVCPDIYFTVE